ncbi:uncharacterized protein TEOVI_000351500 [Trypanosoma equiperdum]|uniref:Uncharacterized protein n=1 Tax=Trypanosoma equiperdum TaxID=5694 RepID=A0A1G4II26_TRYEQ|nr:hypothetical protein, conserved [Trypanosoma equiperdum]
MPEQLGAEAPQHVVPEGDQSAGSEAGNVTRGTKNHDDSDPFVSLRYMEDRKQLETQARAVVTALLAEKGEVYVQGLLQAEIQRVKKKESEAAAIKKKISAATKLAGELKGDIRRETEAKAEEEHMCKNLQAEMKRRSTLTEEATRRMESRRLTLKKDVETSVRDVREKYDDRKRQAMELVEENKRLTDEVAKMRKEFDEARATYADTCKERETYVESLIRSYREVTREVETLEAKIALVRRERQASEQRKASLEKQLESYNSQFGSLSEGQSVEDAERMAKEQREEAEARIAQLESEKKEASEIRLRLDKETATWRAALAAHKRELPRLEKAKLAAEKRCRQAQERARQQLKEDATTTKDQEDGGM